MVPKLSIKNPKTIFATIFILQYLSWTFVVSIVFDIDGVHEKGLNEMLIFQIFLEDPRRDPGINWGQVGRAESCLRTIKR
jgi:hypothetical protein